MVVAVATFVPSIVNATGTPPRGELPPSNVAEKVTDESAGEGFALEVTVRPEEIRLTVTEALLQLLGAKLASPEYVQVMVSVPLGSVDVVSLAMPLASVTVEIVTPLLEKVTVPVGDKVIPSTTSSSKPPTVAVNVAADPAVTVVGLTASVLVLGAWLTVSVNEAVALA